MLYNQEITSQGDFEGKQNAVYINENEPHESNFNSKTKFHLK